MSGRKKGPPALTLNPLNTVEENSVAGS